MKAFASRVADLNRLRFITSVFFEEGFAFIVSRLNLSWAVAMECRIRCFVGFCRGKWIRQPSSDELPSRLRLALIKLGPTFVKLGQILSLRPDIVPPALAAELSKLTSQVPPVPYEDAKKIIETDFSKPLAELFKKFEKVPLAAGSLAQVHKAMLPDGTPVAVKVQRPGIEQIIDKDIRVLAMIARLVEARSPRWGAYRPSAIVEEFADTIRRELDFTIEAIHAKRFDMMFEGDPGVKVAKVFTTHSSRRVLTMDLLEGVRLDDEAALAKAGVHTDKLAENGVKALLKQIFVEGFFHADPHPGNYFALSGNVFAFIDYGMVGRLSAKDRLTIAAFFTSFMNQDSEAAIGHLLRLTDTGEAVNLSSFEHDVDDILHEWYGAKLKEVNLGSALYRIIESARRHKIYFPSGFVYLGKSLLTTESMGRSLDPEFDLADQLKPYTQNIIKAELDPARLKKQIATQGLTLAYLIRSLPELSVAALERFASGEINVRIDRAELAETTRHIISEGRKKLLIIALVAVIVAITVNYLVSLGLLNLHVSAGLGLIISVSLLLYLTKWHQ